MKKGLVMSAADVEAHQRKHFGRVVVQTVPVAQDKPKLPKPRQNATEREYGLILEAMKRRGDIMDT
jgi:hypothetical protein